MARGINRLSGADLKRKRPGLYCDGGGLWLQVTLAKDGERLNRSWIFRYAAGGRTREMGLGSLNTIGLAEARAAALRCRKLRHEGVDPIAHRDAERAAKAAAAAKSMTFEQCAYAYISAHRAEWRNEKHAQQWPSSLRKHVFPTLGRLPVAAIDTPLVLAALKPVWTSAPETASRLRGRIESILDWATVAGLRQGDNPARWTGHLEHLLPARGKIRVHLSAMPYIEVPAFLAELRTVDSTAARAFEFLILTAARRGEVLGATWSEIDLDAGVWTIPAMRMKAGKLHRVPLSPRCLAILSEVKEHHGAGDLVFGRLPERCFNNLLKRLGHPDVTPHGFRSAFRDWCGERTSFAREVAEAALAHQVGGAVERAYRRSDALEKRRQLMSAWGRYCTQPPAGGDVVPLHSIDKRL